MHPCFAARVFFCSRTIHSKKPPNRPGLPNSIAWICQKIRHFFGKKRPTQKKICKIFWLFRILTFILQKNTKRTNHSNNKGVLLFVLVGYLGTIFFWDTKDGKTPIFCINAASRKQLSKFLTHLAKKIKKIVIFFLICFDCSRQLHYFCEVMRHTASWLIGKRKAFCLSLSLGT